jgi:radical SAM protein with 4Fe4S-binding SPASM domain
MKVMRKVALPFPKTISIETNSLCNGNCMFCPYNAENEIRKATVLNAAVVYRVIDEAAKENIEQLVFYINNEPILDDRMIGFIRYARERMHNNKLIFSSNGKSLSSEIIADLITSGINRFHITIPTLDSRHFKMIMGFELSPVLFAIQALSPDMWKYIRISIPKTKYYNKVDFDIFFGKRGIKFESWEMEANTRWSIYENIASISTLQFGLGCDRPLDTMFISSNGDVITCSRDWKHDNVMGNVYDSTIKEIWESDRMKRLQQFVIDKNFATISCCSTCSRVLEPVDTHSTKLGESKKHKTSLS